MFAADLGLGSVELLDYYVELAPTYVIRFTSYARPAIDTRRRPLAFAFPGGAAQSLSGMIKP